MTTEDNATNAIDTIPEPTTGPIQTDAVKEARLAEKMAAAFDDIGGYPPIPDAVEETTPAESPDIQSTTAVTPQADSKTLDELTADIPPQLWRAAMWQRQFNGLAPQELAEFWHSNPEMAEKHFNGYYEAMNRANQQAAELGRQQVNQQAAVTPQPAPVLKPLTAEDIEEQPEALLEQLNLAIQTVNQQQQFLNQQQEQARIQYQMQVAQEVVDFFESPQMKPFADYYGDKVVLNNPNVSRVLLEADAIMAGAKQQGREMTPIDALQAAHDMITAPMIKDRVRQEIQGTLKKRAQGVTFRPSHKTGQAANSGDAKEQRLREKMLAAGLIS